MCSRAYIVQTGNQPTNGSMWVHFAPAEEGMGVTGYENEGEKLTAIINIIINAIINIIIYITIITIFILLLSLRFTSSAY